MVVWLQETTLGYHYTEYCTFYNMGMGYIIFTEFGGEYLPKFSYLNFFIMCETECGWPQKSLATGLEAIYVNYTS